ERFLVFFRFFLVLRLGGWLGAVLSLDHVAIDAVLHVGDLVFEGERHLVAGIGLHAPLVAFLGVGKAVDVLAARPPVAGRGQLERTGVVFHPDDVLDAALAKAAFADDYGAMVVLEGGGDDLTGAGAVLVDEHGDRIFLGGQHQGAGFLGLVNLRRLIAPARADDDAVGQEQVAN